MINNSHTLEQLEQMKLSGMAQVYRGIMDMPVNKLPGLHELIARLVESEKQDRVRHRTQLYLKLSNLRYDAVLEQIQCSPTRNISRDQILSLADCSFIQRAENILNRCYRLWEKLPGLRHRPSGMFAGL